MKKIYVALSTFAKHGREPLDILEASGIDFDFNTLGRRLLKTEISRFAKDCHGIIAGVEPYDADVLDALPNLECISRCGIGTDNIDHVKTKQRGIIICNTPDVVTQPVAELTIAMIFGLLRRLSQHTASLRSGNWVKFSGNLLQGKTVGILGVGRIGKRVAELLSVLGVHIIGADLFPDKEWMSLHKMPLVTTERLFKDSDIVSLHLSKGTIETFVLGANQIRMMKKGTYIVNTSRGELIDESALASALESGHIAGAALDVFSQEPYKGPLCAFDNIILTPHVATLTDESRLQMEVEATKNLLDQLSYKGLGV